MDSYSAEVRAFRDAVRAVQRRLRHEIPTARGVSRPAMQCLLVICRLPGASPTAVGAELRMTSSNVASALRELDRAGLVERRRDPSDSRRALLEPTADGTELVARYRNERDTWLGRAIAATLTEDERSTLLAVAPLMHRVAEFDQAAR